LEGEGGSRGPRGPGKADDEIDDVDDGLWRMPFAMGLNANADQISVKTY